MVSFPSLDGFGPSRETLHRYAQAINALARVHATERPHWWHTSLKVVEDGLISDPIPLPSGGDATFLMDFGQARIVLSTDDMTETFPMGAGWSGTQMGDALIAAAADLGLHGDYARERFESDAPGVYDAEAAGRFFTALTSADRVFKAHRDSLSGETSPVQLWPHGFDLSTEWYSPRQVTYESGGEEKTAPAQLNLGFYPAGSNDDAYFYSSPWPFERETLLGRPLVVEASWNTDGWQGAKLPYTALLDQPGAADFLGDFARVVFGVAAPTLID